MQTQCGITPEQKTAKDVGDWARVPELLLAEGDACKGGAPKGMLRDPGVLPHGRKVPGGGDSPCLGRSMPSKQGHPLSRPTCTAKGASSEFSFQTSKEMLMNNVGKGLGATLQEDVGPKDVDKYLMQRNSSFGLCGGDPDTAGVSPCRSRDKVGCGGPGSAVLEGCGSELLVHVREGSHSQGCVVAREAASDAVGQESDREHNDLVGESSNAGGESGDHIRVGLRLGVSLIGLAGGGSVVVEGGDSRPEAQGAGPDHRGAGVWSSSSSGPPLRRRPAQDCMDFRVSLSSWNLAGASKKKVADVMSTVADTDVLGVQEYPKLEVGWHMLSHDRYSGVVYQDILMCRAVGILYNASKFSIVKRRKSGRGVWVLLQHLESGQRIWAGSVHLPVNEAVEEVDRHTAEFLNALPATSLTCVILGDFNTQFTWTLREEGVVPRKLHSRWSRLRQAMAERGFQQVPPREEDMSAPTYVPRRQGYTGTQIDGMFGARGHMGLLRICDSSRHELATDHERVEGLLVLQGKRMKERRMAMGGPRQLVSPPPPRV